MLIILEGFFLVILFKHFYLFIYFFILECWDNVPENRPTIDKVVNRLAQAKNDQTDDQFFVLNDGQEAQFTETKTTTDRTLTIPFTDGTGQIEIIGTFIVPEFGPIAALVLAIAIISIIVVSAKTGLRFMPKY